jgi:(E)-4-hydroxy-3-methylbut-2-enyl-diphosphate synthase
MTNTETANVEATVSQIARLERAGCELVRVAVPRLAAAKALPAIKERIGIPLVADVHFDPRLALAAIEAGVDKLRLNPGNITDEKEIARVARAAKTRGIPIRVGANSGSLAPQFRDSQGRAAAKGLVESALREVCLLEDLGFTEIVLSVKGTDVPMTVAAYRAVASRVDYPLHLGITEAGTAWDGAIRSAVGLGILLEEGLGDTLRVSLAADPVEEVRAAYEILRSLHLRERGIAYHVCPTCGRTGIDLVAIAGAVREELEDVVEPLNVALMGCVVNGPGEAAQADFGLVGGRGEGTLYLAGSIVARGVPEGRIAAELVRLVRARLAEKASS